jgi:chemotaxis protein MotB
VAKDRVQIVGLADTRPLAPNTDEKGHNIPENQAKNRRVVVLVTP